MTTHLQTPLETDPVYALEVLGVEDIECGLPRVQDSIFLDVATSPRFARSRRCETRMDFVLLGPDTPAEDLRAGDSEDLVNNARDTVEIVFFHNPLGGDRLDHDVVELKGQTSLLTVIPNHVYSVRAFAEAGAEEFGSEVHGRTARRLRRGALELEFQATVNGETYLLLQRLTTAIVPERGLTNEQFDLGL